MATYQIRQLWKKCQFDPEFISQCWDGFGYETRLQSVPILFEKGNNFLWRRDSTWRWTCPGWGLPDGKIQIDASELEQRIKEDGMAAIDRMLLFRGRSESPEKVPASCLISAFGEVFHGVNGLNEYWSVKARNHLLTLSKRLRWLRICMNQICEDSIIWYAVIQRKRKPGCALWQMKTWNMIQIIRHSLLM